MRYRQQLLFEMLFNVKYIEPNKSKMLANANTKPNFKIAIDPESPKSEIKSGLQNGHVVAKKLTNIPLTPVVVEV